ncbi:MAG: glycosyltransferase family 4 protein [Saprospiraceae bacterium]|nr:glycosyltransferase family 4 protein [Saprospiraceae bacterium]
MKTVTLEMERLRNLNSGLGQYCLHLGRALAQAPQGMHFVGYMAEYLSGILGPAVTTLPLNKCHKWTGVPVETNLWHCMHQDSAYFPKRKNAVLTMTIHDLNFLERPDYGAWKKKLKTKRLQHKIDRCRGLVYISDYVKSWVHRSLNVPSGTVEQVIYNGVQVEAATMNQTHAAMAPYLFSIGMHPKKNYEVALPILQANPGLRWVIAGSDVKNYRAKLTGQASKMGVSDRLMFAGPISETDKWQWYAQCEAFVFPSLSEGFGLPVLEAMAFGKPVFLSNRTSLPEIGGSEAYYFESFEPTEVVNTFEQGMQHFNNDPEKAQRLKNWSAGFTWQKAAQSYAAFFETMLSNNPQINHN